MDIQIFGKVVDSTVLALMVAVIGVIIAYLNYRKKPVLKEETSQSVSDSTGVVQQSADNMNIGKQITNTGAHAINLINCTFIIQNMNPNDLDKESVVKKVSECITKNIPEVTGALIKDAAFELSGDKLKLMNAAREKVEQYEKSTGKIVKDAGILRALGIEAFYLGKQDDAFKYFSEALGLDEEFRDIRGKAIDLNYIGLVYQVWGKPEKALEYVEIVLRLFEELKDVRSAAVVRYNIETLRSCIKDQ